MAALHSAASRLRLLVRVPLLALVVGVALSNWGCPRRDPVLPDEVRGSIAIHGYVVDPADLLVRARPVLTEPSGGGKADPPRSVTVSASRVAGSGPPHFEFRLRGLVPGAPYRIGIKVANQDSKLYPRLAWSASRDPVTTPGDGTLRFDAYAVRSEIEVMGAAAGRERAAWVAADALDFTDPAVATRSFRWRTTVPGVTGGQLQVSLTPFPRIGRQGYDPCPDSDEGLVYTQYFTADVAAGEWITLPGLDFNALLEGGRDTSPDGPRSLAGSIGPAREDPDWDMRTLPKLHAGHPLYVRVLPRVGGQLVCDPERGGVPPEVLLARVVLALLDALPAEDPEVSVGTVWYTKPAYDAHPTSGETCYRVIKDHKVLPLMAGGSVWDLLVAERMSGVSYNQTATRGKGFCVPPKDDDGFLEDFLDSFGAVLTGAVDALADLVNYTSKLWEEIQDAVVDAAASAVNQVGIVDCGPGSDCRAALETGLEVGLAAMGVPPSLPNFDDLMDQGFDYLAAEVASQAGVPEVLTDYASQEAQDFVKEEAKHQVGKSACDQ